MTPSYTNHSHKDLGVIVSDNLNWNIHHDAILSKTYRTLDLVRRTFSTIIPTSGNVKLYTSLIRYQVLYCSPVWWCHLIKDIKKQVDILISKNQALQILYLNTMYHKRGKICWDKHSQFQPYEGFHGNTFAVPWPAVFII